MNVHLIVQLIELDTVVKPSRREFKSWSWNNYIGILVLFISLLIRYYFFSIVHGFIPFINCIISQVFFFFFFFGLFFLKLFAI